MNKLDKDYKTLLQDILDTGHQKGDRTGTGTISVFGRQIRHKMSDGFPLLTTKKMYFKGIVTELLWFLRGDTNIKYLVDNDCHIWDGDCFANYIKHNPNTDEQMISDASQMVNIKEWFINKIKTDDAFAKKWGELGPIYGKQWRSWGRSNVTNYDLKDVMGADQYKIIKSIENGEDVTKYGVKIEYQNNSIDQIANLIRDIKTNPDSRRLMVNAWNVGELDQMVLPPCHYGFQVYTRELSYSERYKIWFSNNYETGMEYYEGNIPDFDNSYYTPTPKRAISLMWNQRSVDTFLGLPFNIASYGLLLEIIAKAVNMVPDELIGNLGDTHLYSNHIEQAKEQIGRELSLEERYDLMPSITGHSEMNIEQRKKINNFVLDDGTSYHKEWLDSFNIPTRTREPYPLPTLNINTEFWPYEGGSCGEGPLDAIKVFESFSDDNFCRCLLEEDIQLGNYQSHPSIKAPVSN